jgi:Fic family protein
MTYMIPRLGDPESAAIERIEELGRELRWRVAEPRRWFGNLRRQIFARAVQGSNSIEGYNASLEDVLAVVEDEETIEASTDTILALQGYRDAMTYVLQLAEEKDHLNLDETLIKSLHYMMLKHDLTMRPGRWRIGPIFVRRDPENEIVYEGPEPELVPALMHDLVESANAGSDPPLVQAAMAHLNLVMIHPFKDGNGRMARCLQTLVLARESIVAPVFSSIEEYLGRNTEAYYAVLGEVGQGSWHPSNDARPWIRFCLNAHYQQAQTLIWRMREAESLWERCEAIAASRRLPERVIGPLCDAARGLRLRNSSYRTAGGESFGAEIDVQTASRDLRTLVAAGLLITRGETRGRYYWGAPDLRREFQEIRADRPKRTTTDLFQPAAGQ